MRLLHFAHRNEAQEFLKRKEYRSVPESGLDLYQNEGELLLISKEGVFESLKKMSFLLAKFPITEVINLGVAGALSSELEKEKIYEVRTIYAFQDRPLFQSFEIAKSGIDLITTFDRVLSDEFAKTLAPFAKMVDREAWAIAYALKGTNATFKSYKLISDYAGNETKCFDIKELAQSYSEKLYDFYEKHIATTTQITSSEKSDLGPFEKLYLTHQQRIKLTNALLKLSQKEEKTLNEIYESLNFEIKSTSKELTNRITEEVLARLNPFKTKIQEALQQAVRPLTDSGAKVHFDPSFEKKSFTLSMEVNSDKNLENLQKALLNTKFQDFEKVFKGEFDV